MSQARNGRSEWFELSEEGWRRSNRARPLGQLVREALQNAFDQRARRVKVRLEEDEVRIEDDAPTGRHATSSPSPSSSGRRTRLPRGGAARAGA
ncbi:ATP-binding protein [Cystobacter fuscus]